MRQRHTSRTDPEVMGGTKVPVTFRLGEEARDRLLAASHRRMPDIANISDALQDAVWLWIYEDEQVHGPHPAPAGGGGVGSPASKSAEATEPDQVAQGTGSGESGPWNGASDHAVPDRVPG